jgi:hypothetical protein
MNVETLEDTRLVQKYTHKNNGENVLVAALLRKEIFLDGIGACEYQSEIIPC